MLNALLYGVVAALSFIGFVCVVLFAILHFYKTGGNSKYIIRIPRSCSAGEIEKLIYGTYLKKSIFGDLIFDSVEFDESELSEDERALIGKIKNELKEFYADTRS